VETCRGLSLIGRHVDTKNPCPSSLYFFCVDVSYGNSGPYIEYTCYTAGSYYCAPQYYLISKITNVRTGKPISKKYSNSWNPNPMSSGPSGISYQDITEINQIPPSKFVRAVDVIWACTGQYGSGSCKGPWSIGLIPQ
jgi:hypothetical protein